MSRQRSTSKVPRNCSFSSANASKDSQSLCSVCEKPINDKTEDSIFCEGICKGWMYRTCAGLSKTAFNAVSESDDDFFCHYCSSKCLRDEIKALKRKVSSLEASLRLYSTIPLAQPSSAETETGSPRSYSSVVQSKRQISRNPIDKVYESKKFSIVVYGIKECSEGSPRLTRSDNDVKEITEIIHTIDPELSSQSVCDCTRLGKYSTKKTRQYL